MTMPNPFQFDQSHGSLVNDSVKRAAERVVKGNPNAAGRTSILTDVVKELSKQLDLFRQEVRKHGTPPFMKEALSRAEQRRMLERMTPGERLALSKQVGPELFLKYVEDLYKRTGSSGKPNSGS